MIRNWYNQIPYPALKTKREIIKYINWRQFTKGTRGKQNEQLFPIQLPKIYKICMSEYGCCHKHVLNIKSEMRSFKSNENIHKKEGGSYYVVSANKASSVTL